MEISFPYYKSKESATVLKKLIIDIKVILDKQNISDYMNEDFYNVGEKLQAEIPDYGLKYIEYMPPRTANSFYLEPVTSEDIMLEITRMKPNKSPSHDLIGSKVIKLCPGILAYNMAMIYNWSI